MSGVMGEAVKVIVRCRPMNEREKSLKCQSVIEVDTAICQCRISKPGDKSQPPKLFTFDGVYGPDSITESIYADICFPLVDGVVEGYNGTVFAYGQTGCGKSFSMQGVNDPLNQRGIIPRAFEHVFESVQVSETAKYLIHASYLEIYNEDIRDLVGKDQNKKLEVKEHPDKGVYVKDLTLVPCHTVKDMDRVMERGGQNRHVGATLMNADSSRSHSIFTIYIETCEAGADGQQHIRAGKLHLVDLAGSERQAKTGATGDRLKEATKINLSLSALGNVISALVDGKATHIPYRDSKLTRLLQDSLGGNTKTMMVACISPADNNYDETLSTLRYANRAKNIKNKPKINEDPKDALLRQYQDEITILKQVLMGQMELTPDMIAKLGLSGAIAPGSPAVPQTSPFRKPAPVPILESKAFVEAETERITKEYEDKLAHIQTLYEQEQLSKQKLEENLGKLLEEYEHNLQQAKAPYTSAVDPAEAEEAEKVVAEFQVKSLSLERQDDWSPEVAEVKSSEKPLSRSGSPSLPNRMAAKALELVKDKLSSSMQNLAVSVSVRGGDFETPDIHEGEGPAKVAVTSGVIQMASQFTQEAVKRLHSLQQQLVGGEKSSDSSLKERRRKLKEHALAKQAKLLKTVRKMEDDGIMVKVYDNMQEEIKIKSKLVEQRDTDLRAANIEIQDLQFEFETERQDYLDTIRKLEQQLLLQKQIIERIQPCIRRDCNYFNVDKVRTLSVFDEDGQFWRLPELVIERSVLPAVTETSKPSPLSPRQNVVDVVNIVGDAAEYHNRGSEEKLLARLNKGASEDFASSYFKPRRAEKLLTSSAASSGSNNNFEVFRKEPSPLCLSPIAALEPVRRPQKLEAIPADLLMKGKKKNGK